MRTTQIYTHVTQNGPQAVRTPLTRARAAMQNLEAGRPDPAAHEHPGVLDILAESFSRLRARIADYISPRDDDAPLTAAI